MIAPPSPALLSQSQSQHLLFLQGAGPSAGVWPWSKLQDPLLHLQSSDLSDAVVAASTITS